MSIPNIALIPPPPAGDISARIGQARGYLRLSQDQLIAKMAAIDPDRTVTRRTYSKWENGHTSPTIDQLVTLAKATGFPVYWFVAGLDEGSKIGNFATPPSWVTKRHLTVVN